MDIGISTFPTDYSVDIALAARRAEELGFESLSVPEHPILPAETKSPWPGSPDGVIPKYYADIVDPFVALGRASAVTTTLKLGTGICLVPERNPLLLAAPASQGSGHPGHVLGRALFVRHWRWVAERGDGDHGGGLPPPLASDPGGGVGDERAMDQDR